MTPAGGTRRARWAALGLLAAAAALWLLWGRGVLAPLRLVLVLLHELGHAAAAVATGGTVRRIAVTAGEAGWCDCPGGDAFVTLSAGYLGSVAWGAALVAAATAGARWTRGALVALGGALAGVVLLWGHGLVTVAVGVGSGLVLAAVGVRARSAVARGTLASLGLASCLYAVLDVKADVLERPGAPSDAAALADLTGVPALVWGGLWWLASLAVFAWAARRAWERL